jgi:hypothetical protein
MIATEVLVIGGALADAPRLILANATASHPTVRRSS